MNNPGWVDLQVNGCLGVDFSDPDLNADGILNAIQWVLSHGTEIFLPTLITSPFEILERNMHLIRETVRRHNLSAHVPGVHLEGPFISRQPGAVGAHNPEYAIRPTLENTNRLLQSADGFIRMMTVAAEEAIATGVIPLLRANGVLVSVGHHMAGTEEIRKAADEGALTLTHLGNGVPNLLDRHRNPIWAGLAESRLSAMIIADGHHLPEDILRCILRAKGVDRIIVTSDASPAAGFPPGPCHVLGNDAILEPDGRLHNPVKKCLVGSTAMLADCMKHLAGLEPFSEKDLMKLGRENALNLLKGARGCL